MSEKMNCSLCERTIENYNPELHHLVIDEAHAAELCPDCVRKVFRWQADRMALLFPTRALKRRLKKRRE